MGGLGRQSAIRRLPFFFRKCGLRMLPRLSGGFDEISHLFKKLNGGSSKTVKEHGCHLSCWPEGRQTLVYSYDDTNRSYVKDQDGHV